MSSSPSAISPLLEYLLIRREHMFKDCDLVKPEHGKPAQGNVSHGALPRSIQLSLSELLVTVTSVGAVSGERFAPDVHSAN